MCDVIPNKKSGEDIEYPSLDFIEDSYLPKLDSIVTPSLDEVPEWPSRVSEDTDFHYDSQTNDYFCDWSADEAEQYLRSLTLDQILDVPSTATTAGVETITPSVSADELQTVETEFTPLRLAASDKLKAKLFRLFRKKSLRDVRVTFIDFSKPYLAKVSSGDNYKQFLHIGHSTG